MEYINNIIKVGQKTNDIWKYLMPFFFHVDLNMKGATPPAETFFAHTRACGTTPVQVSGGLVM